MKKSTEANLGSSCPYGYLIGQDFFEHNECDNECPNNIFYKCKDINHSCTHKADFGSEIIAKKMARETGTKDQKYGHYKCEYCGGWHIGRNWD